MRNLLRLANLVLSVGIVLLALTQLHTNPVLSLGLSSIILLIQLTSLERDME